MDSIDVTSLQSPVSLRPRPEFDFDIEPHDLGDGSGELNVVAGRLACGVDKLVGWIVIVSTDNNLGPAPEFRREPKPDTWEAGIGTIISIEGMVELGMTPMEAIVAASKHGAMACKGLEDFGTIEVGKIADLLVLGSNPLDDISNIRNLELILREGRVVDPDTLPTKPVWHQRKSSSP